MTHQITKSDVIELYKHHVHFPALREKAITAEFSIASKEEEIEEHKIVPFLKKEEI
jgi:hypothetical protein